MCATEKRKQTLGVREELECAWGIACGLLGQGNGTPERYRRQRGWKDDLASAMPLLSKALDKVDINLY